MPSVISDLTPLQRAWLYENQHRSMHAHHLQHDADISRLVTMDYGSTNPHKSIFRSRQSTTTDADYDRSTNSPDGEDHHPKRPRVSDGDENADQLYQQQYPHHDYHPYHQHYYPSPPHQYPSPPLHPPDHVEFELPRPMDDPSAHDDVHNRHRHLPLQYHPELHPPSPSASPIPPLVVTGHCDQHVAHGPRSWSHYHHPPRIITAAAAPTRPAGGPPLLPPPPPPTRPPMFPAFPYQGDKITWEQSISNLEAYRDYYGDCNVPQKYRGNPKLGGWVNKQRKKHKNPYKYGRLTEEQVTKLNQMGFKWE